MARGDGPSDARTGAWWGIAAFFGLGILVMLLIAVGVL